MTKNNQEYIESSAGKPKGRLTLISIFAIAFVPMVLATYMYFNNVLVPSGRTNHGTLILPPLVFDELELMDVAGQPLKVDAMEAKWMLLVLSDGVCERACSDALYKARQVNVALHKESDRVIRYLVDVSGDGLENVTEKHKTEYPQLHYSSADRFHLKRYLDHKVDANTALTQSYILVVDPIGNIMMYFTEQNSGKDLLEDLKRLLKVSRIG
ncbi:MAG: hypothetical protein H6995_15075 [Pseudomonadales bacterium]|nr:hypothetical protein [Pseudomonadales bacterium]MCP5216322.1 hypothetical protein [Pseudomonadales bacterium]